MDLTDRSSRGYVTIEEVYRRYGFDLLRFLHGAHPHLNHQDCEDLLHQAILKAVAKIVQHDPQRGSLRLWLMGILRNEVRMDLRQRRRDPATLTPELETEADDAAPAADADLVSSEELSRIEEALAALPFAEREALLAPIRTEGLATTDEIASRLGLAPGSVAVYRQRARKRLRESLQRRGLDLGGTLWDPKPRARARNKA